MKKTNSMRVAVVMLALTLITSSFVGGTFAKYTTSEYSENTAKVAKFGVVIEGPDDLFKPDYNTDDEDAAFGGDFSVISDRTYTDYYGEEKRVNVVAPGTSGETTLFSITGKPEVAVRINVTLNKYNSLKMICHSMQGISFDDPEIMDWADGDLSHGVTIGGGNDGNDGNGSPEAGASGSTDAEYFPIQRISYTGIYYPIIWTLEKDGKTVCIGNLAYINQYLENLSGEYAPNTDLSTVFGTYKLKWEWKFELKEGDYHPGISTGEEYLFAYYQDLMNTYDTELGDLMAEEGAPLQGVNYSLEEGFALSVTVTQID